MIFDKSKKWKKILDRKQIVLIPVEECEIPIYKKKKCDEIEKRKILYKIFEKVKTGELLADEGKTILKFFGILN